MSENFEVSPATSALGFFEDLSRHVSCQEPATSARENVEECRPDVLMARWQYY